MNSRDVTMRQSLSGLWMDEPRYIMVPIDNGKGADSRARWCVCMATGNCEKKNEKHDDV
jgi:hypothetical protein